MPALRIGITITGNEIEWTFHLEGNEIGQNESGINNIIKSTI
jgi:hypothetical protein